MPASKYVRPTVWVPPADMPDRVVLGDGAVSPGARFEIAVFGINGPISAAPGNFLFVREAKVEFFR